VTSPDRRTDSQITDDILKDMLQVLREVRELSRPEPLVPITADAIAVGAYQCLQCIGEHKAEVHNRDGNRALAKARGADYEEPTEPLPPIRVAVTLAPSWQTLSAMGQMVMACVAVPVCFEHIAAHEKTAEEKAVSGGLLLGRPGLEQPGG
jgi:hypothetical protein